MNIEDRVARAIATAMGPCPSVADHHHMRARAALTIFRAVLLEEVAAIRAQGHITDTDAEQDMREMRALAVWRVVEKIGGNSHD